MNSRHKPAHIVLAVLAVLLTGLACSTIMGSSPATREPSSSRRHPSPASEATSTSRPTRTPLPSTDTPVPPAEAPEISLRGCPTVDDCPEATPIWQLVQFRPHEKPGTFNYDVTVDAGTDLLMIMGWCATTEEFLSDNLQSLQWVLKTVETDYSTSLKTGAYDTDDGQHCQGAGAVIGNLAAGQAYVFDFGFVMQAEVFDGTSNYPAGEYLERFIIQVK